MTHYISVAICIIFTYLTGGLNTGYYLVRYSSGKDIRSQFSGNAGASNAGRILGKKGFAISFAGDFLKGFVIIFAARQLHFSNTVLLLQIPACVLGHIFPLQLGFRGGKGVSTSGGAILAYNPLIFIIAFSILLVIMFVSKSRLYGGLIGILSFGIIAFILNHSIFECGILLFTSQIIIYKHKHDIMLAFNKQSNGK